MDFLEMMKQRRSCRSFDPAKSVSREDIFAAGDMAEFNGRCFNLYMDAVASGKVAGSNAAGDKISFSAKVSPVRLFALGEKLTMP